MTGPVFADDDPPYRFVKLPLKFWKILIRVENGQLLATAMLADQSPLLPQSLPENLGSASFAITTPSSQGPMSRCLSAARWRASKTSASTMRRRRAARPATAKRRGGRLRVRRPGDVRRCT